MVNATVFPETRKDKMKRMKMSDRETAHVRKQHSEERKRRARKRV